MNRHHPELQSDIEAFLRATGMGPTYLGKAAVGNSEIVARLRNGGRVWPDTEARLRNFMSNYLGQIKRNAAPQTSPAIVGNT